MYGYSRWHWKAQDYSSCIVLYPLQVGCHIKSRAKQQWVTVVNSWQNNRRYKCGNCSTCQESTNRCQTTQFNIALFNEIEFPKFLTIKPAIVLAFGQKHLAFTEPFPVNRLKRVQIQVWRNKPDEEYKEHAQWNVQSVCRCMSGETPKNV